ncbi:hypothetical protein BWI96_05955 [Siphonobacter sp. SORGH_AS_0500]|uniref:response regulator transcription factor n=1 Tax=Siphonobacter sp. SORGH_AS_0500 TaxID=1864824 RepID=UPI000CB042C6|nr:response regulator transcription factor [Siphonobacter sp. SORGH_AS_0500]PKK37411.1 hypothetical protein BWI96_05955 [Siphonobacter sp. SORGH_AS_0500]
MTHLLLADDHQMILDGLKALLAHEPDLLIMGEAHTGLEVIELANRHAEVLQIIILDINMPGQDGIQTTRYLRKHFPSIRILILSMYNNPVFIRSLMQEGISGYVLKNTGKDELLQAITNISGGSNYFSTEITHLLIPTTKNQQAFPESQLTKRELEILRLLAQGHTTVTIADQLFLSTYTVDTHRKNILSKLNLKNTPALVKYAMEKGLADFKI